MWRRYFRPVIAAALLLSGFSLALPARADDWMAAKTIEGTHLVKVHGTFFGGSHFGRFSGSHFSHGPVFIERFGGHRFGHESIFIDDGFRFGHEPIIFIDDGFRVRHFHRFHHHRPVVIVSGRFFF